MAVLSDLIKEVWAFADDRLFHWPLGRRPDDLPGLTELGL